MGKVHCRTGRGQSTREHNLKDAMQRFAIHQKCRSKFKLCARGIFQNTGKARKGEFNVNIYRQLYTNKDASDFKSRARCHDTRVKQLGILFLQWYE